LAEAITVLSSHLYPNEVKRELEQSQPLQRFKRLCVELAGITLEAAGVANSRDEGRSMATDALDTGQAYRKYQDWFSAQRVPFDPHSVPNYFDRPLAEVRNHDGPGWVRRVDAGIVGQTVLDLGGGRKRKDDEIDLGVGANVEVCVGQRVEPNDVLCRVYGRTTAEAEAGARSIQSGIEISRDPVPEPPLILEVM
ncbi:MAG TPA: hypothetical protein VGE01_06980, partial [Fimbriimonas sp.]